MSQPSCLGNGGATPCQCLVRKAEAEKHDPQMRLCRQLRVEPGLRDKRMNGVRIVKRKHRFQMRTGQGKPSGVHQVPAG